MKYNRYNNNLVMAMLGNHTCTEGYNVGVLISNAICYIQCKSQGVIDIMNIGF